VLIALPVLIEILHIQHLQDEKPEEVFRRRTGSSMFYVDRRSKTYEGYLFKKGKMVKNWKLRWFILDLETKEVRLC